MAFLSPKDDMAIMDQWAAKGVNLLYGSEVVKLSPTGFVSSANTCYHYDRYCLCLEELKDRLNEATLSDTEERIFSQRGSGTWRAYVENMWQQTVQGQATPNEEEDEQWKDMNPLVGKKSETASKPILQASAASEAVPFEITLRDTYYDMGYINPGADASAYLGDDGDQIEVSFDDGTEPVTSSINRRANPNGSVRIVGRNRPIAGWFQKHFQKGDVVRAQVVDAHRVLLLSKLRGS